jgi:hypothetical protein
MARETASYLAKKLESRGGRMYTRSLQTPVIVGEGYATGMIFGTAPLFGYRSDVFTSSERRGDLLDRSNNNLYAIAERTYLVGFDPCPVLKVTFTPTP